MALTQEYANVAGAAEGTRNDTLNTAAFNMGQLVGGGFLKADQVEQRLTEAGQACGLGNAEIARTLGHALADGMQKPRVVKLTGGTDVDDAYTVDPRTMSAATADATAGKYPVVDWHAAYAAQPEDIPWLVEPVLERGLSYALYAPAKAGKSLLLQDIAGGLAARRSVFGNPDAGPVRILYVDLENAMTDVVERMSAAGHTPDELADLRYLSFPALPPLDTARGGRDLAELAVHHGADLVVIDTVSRVIEGGENDADTLHALYRYALRPLKGAGITVVRLDHAGKDPTKGQRGSSAKSGDVDVVWRLEVDGPAAVTMHRDDARNAHHPDKIHLIRRFEPFRHEIADGEALESGMIAAVEALDAAEVPDTAGRETCRRALVGVGVKVSNDTLASAVRHRKTRPGQVTEE